jgi:hypothetical protein
VEILKSQIKWKERKEERKKDGIERELIEVKMCSI